MNTDIYDRGRETGRRLQAAIEHNLDGFWRAVADRDIDRNTVRTVATDHRDRLTEDTRSRIRGMADAAAVPYRDLLAFNLFEETLVTDGCTTAIAAGDAAADGETIFFKQSDKKGADEFEGENYHQHQQINVVSIENPADKNKIIGVTAAGSTAVKMGMNDEGVAIGSNISRTVTFDEEGTDSKDWAAASRGEYMRQGLLHGDTAEEVAKHITPMLFSDPMSSPGNIPIADAEKAIILEGEFTHLASEWVEDDVIGRANKFQALDHLARSREEIPSSYSRYERVMEVLEENDGDVTVETMRDLSTDHENGPGLESVCRHEEDHYTDETSLSAAIFDLDGEAPETSEIYIALGKPCHAWRTEEGNGWLNITADATEADVPDRFLTGEAWLEHYTEEAYEGERELAPLR
ncbi:C45 family autoproteolytic acyltransferase/hydolase [Natrinema gelatinilyticum]|uniref:C45 family autoproteolytic acyltransferase/hydolase n=1 Tax=Natrinema gelatinilyticum TaxID=2961571 RepID=UPI0020C3022B|nr:C45 family autoproteolytic acyltransferase/hydolase [Natrinema gelatinilyticum]